MILVVSIKKRLYWGQLRDDRELIDLHQKQYKLSKLIFQHDICVTAIMQREQLIVKTAISFQDI